MFSLLYYKQLEKATFFPFCMPYGMRGNYVTYYILVK